jgi:hypothetical protein
MVEATEEATVTCYYYDTMENSKEHRQWRSNSKDRVRFGGYGV